MSGSPSARAVDFLQDDAAFGIVGGAAARQHQLAVEVALHDLIRANDADWVLQPVEAGNLREDAAVRVNVVSRENLLDISRIQFAILFRKRINRGIEKILRNRELAREFGRRKNRGIVTSGERAEEIPHVLIRPRQIDVAAPDPVGVYPPAALRSVRSAAGS